ncbi:hypothetical protein IG631_20379 [Alternaria alternata]|nr:hypothetical protein IG631_20379 [Alternaria alternata]
MMSADSLQLTTVPGQVMYNGAKIQILDLPGIIQGAKDGKGRGRQVIAVAKTCHLIFIVLDVNKPLTDKRVIENELEGFGIRINKSPPNIVLKKKDKGGINITATVPLTHIDHGEIKAVLNEYRMANADVAIRCDATVDDLIDVIEAKGRSYIPVIYALNKIDAISIEELDLLYRIPNACPISSEHGWNIDELLEQMWEKLNLVRVYTKPKGKMPDYSAPVVLRSTACTIEDFISIVWPIFWSIGFPYWSTNGRSGRFGEISRGQLRWRLRRHAVSRALNHYRSRDLSGWSAKPRFSMGAIIAAFRKRFSRRHFLSLLYAQPMIDVLPLPWESPPPRVPEQH